MSATVRTHVVAQDINFDVMVESSVLSQTIKELMAQTGYIVTTTGAFTRIFVHDYMGVWQTFCEFGGGEAGALNNAAPLLEFGANEGRPDLYSHHAIRKFFGIGNGLWIPKNGFTFHPVSPQHPSC